MLKATKQIKKGEAVIIGQNAEEKEETFIQKIPAKTLEWGQTCEDKLNWKDAKEWCVKQGKGWRLPTRLELLQAFYDKVPGFKIDDCYWSETEYSATHAWYTYFTYGYQNGNNKTNTYYVRCCREK